MILASFRAGLAEFFVLRGARAKVQSYDPERLAGLRVEKRAARTRLGAASRLADPRAALDVLALAAAHTQLAEKLAHIEPETNVMPDASVVPASFAQAEALRGDVEVAIHQALARIESRTPTEIAGLRIGRFGAVGVALLFIALSIASHVGIRNVALHKPVTTSGVRDGTAESLVDGRTRRTFAVQTSDQPHPFITIDLERSYAIARIKVYNRGDGWFDEILPLTLEASVDGQSFQEIARRTEHFDVWTVDAGVTARYVRMTKDSGYIALNAVEVYGR
jgi:hypothetical protein